MDPIVAARLDEENSLYEAPFYRKLAKLCRDYVLSGLQQTQYYSCDFDAAGDLIEGYAPLPFDRMRDAKDWNRNEPRNFIHPTTATQIWTLATFVSQILFGARTTRKVEPRKDEDEPKAAAVNELLQWNDDQQPTYLQGFLWIKDAMAYNRGIFYENWKTLYEVQMEPVTVEIPWAPKKDRRGNIPAKPANYKAKTYTRYRSVMKPAGGFTQLNLTSPYDFISDPMIPLTRFQESRFAGHRVMLAWTDLEARSKLDPSDYRYVLPAVVKKIKARPASGGSKVFNAPSQPDIVSRSRSYFDRIRRGNPTGGAGMTDAINKEDGGVIECFCLHIRTEPKTYDIYQEDGNPEIIEFLFSGETELLSVNVLPNKHHELPYAVGEGRPNAHYQFSPSWALMIKPIQDYVDYLKGRRQKSIARTSGNIFILDPTMVDIEDFTDPDKDGLFIPITSEASGKPIDNFVKQIPVQDMTARFYEEMNMWISQAEETSGAHSYIQGKQGEDDNTATEFVGVQQMATGRISTLARLLSVSALAPQTRRIVCNLQQFMPESIVIRVSGDAAEYDPDAPPQKYISVQKADIQAEFDVVPSDGALPGPDTRKVAALTRAAEVAGTPMGAQVFDDTVPGNLSFRKVMYEIFRLGGMPLTNFVISKQEAIRNLQMKQMAAGGGIPPQAPPGSPQAPPGPPPPTQPAGAGQSLPSASELPPTPPAAPPGPNPAQV